MSGYQILLISVIFFAQYVKSSPVNVSCTVSKYSDVAAAAKSCSTLTLKNIEIPEKTTMEIALQDGAKLIFDGHITHVPVDWTGDLIKISGNNVHVSGTSSHLLDGLGPKHWKGANEPKPIERPRLLRLNLHKNSEVTALHLKNCPGGCVGIQSSDLVVSSILIDNKDGYPGNAGKNFAKNTDGFDISSSTNVLVKNTVVYNQDDCVAVNGGSNLEFYNLWCNGSHGFSFSVRDGDVHDIIFKNCHMEYADNAIHVKTHNDGTTGTIRNVLYQNITFTAHLLDGLGPKHWKGANEPTIQRPKFLRLQLHKNSEVTSLHLKNCPNNCIMIQSSDTVISNVLIDNKDGYPGIAGTNYAKNTDGFDVGSSSNLLVKNSVVYNQDDCVAVNGGSSLEFYNLWCNGSHGFSFSVRNGDVHDVQFKNSHIQYAGSAIHVKTHNDGSSGTIRNVLYQNITFSDIERSAISIQQNYPKGAAKANIPITNLTLHSVKGKMSGSKSVGIAIICAQNGCSDWKWSDVEILGAKNKNDCENVPSGIHS